MRRDKQSFPYDVIIHFSAGEITAEAITGWASWIHSLLADINKVGATLGIDVIMKPNKNSYIFSFKNKDHAIFFKLRAASGQQILSP